MVVGELLHVAVELDEARFLGDADVAGDVPGDPVPCRPPAEPAPVPGEVVEEVAHLPDVDRVEGQVVEVGVPSVDERHHMVVGVDVEPHAAVAEPVGDPHAEHLGVEGHTVMDRAREAVDMPEPPRPTDMHRRRGARMLRPPVDLRGGRAERHELQTAPVVVDEEQRSVALLVGHALRLEVRPRVGE